MHSGWLCSKNTKPLYCFRSCGGGTSSKSSAKTKLLTRSTEIPLAQRRTHPSYCTVHRVHESELWSFNAVEYIYKSSLRSCGRDFIFHMVRSGTLCSYASLSLISRMVRGIESDISAFGLQNSNEKHHACPAPPNKTLHGFMPTCLPSDQTRNFGGWHHRNLLFSRKNALYANHLLSVPYGADPKHRNSKTFSFRQFSAPFSNLIFLISTSSYSRLPSFRNRLPHTNASSLTSLLRSRFQ